MKKPIAIALAVLFSITVVLSGAFGYFDCAAKCAYEMAKAHPHAAMGPTTLNAPNCCSGGMKSTCEMAGTLEIKIPECSMTSHQTVSAYPIYIIGFLPKDTETDISGPTPSHRRFITGEIKSKLPIYLKTLSILC